VKNRSFDPVAFMRKRRGELSRAYTGLTAEQIEEQVQQGLRNDLLWKKPPEGKPAKEGFAIFGSPGYERCDG
jgi:hypothetical protein